MSHCDLVVRHVSGTDEPEDDFLWPKKGMSLFETTDQRNWAANACMPLQPDWVVYTMGYELAATLLTEHTSAGQDQDFLIYPILFTARQAIELRLKEIILLGSRLSSNETSYPTSHNLPHLWQLARGVLVDAGAEVDKAMSAFDSLLKQVHSADPGSMTFRYPVNKTGDASFSVDDAGIPSLINTRDLGRVLKAMFNYLSGSRDWLENLVDNQTMATGDLSAGDEW